MPKTDKGLVDKVEQQSLLINATDIPVAGSISLISKVKSEFENLVGLLYSEAYYSGTVDIKINHIDICADGMNMLVRRFVTFCI